jgi:hypothetical protein
VWPLHTGKQRKAKPHYPNSAFAPCGYKGSYRARCLYFTRFTRNAPTVPHVISASRACSITASACCAQMSRDRSPWKVLGYTQKVYQRRNLARASLRRILASVACNTSAKSGPGRDRTDYLCLARAALSQVSYKPIVWPCQVWACLAATPVLTGSGTRPEPPTESSGNESGCRGKFF